MVLTANGTCHAAVYKDIDFMGKETKALSSNGATIIDCEGGFLYAG